MTHEIVHFEVGGRDLDSLSRFYYELFGWSVVSFDDDYRLVTAGEGIGGGLMRCQGDIPPYVTVYVSVEDLEETLARAKDHGGSQLVPPTPIPGVGSFAMFQDPEGNVIGIMHMEAAAA